ncbi:MAG: zinc-binding dehydrogenase, partial [Devosia sp.]|nr:zinc-binding dehydrogenase [Devosia sp.]
MASGSLARLSRLLLQRSDRHPIACIDAEDLAAFDRRDTLLCLTLGVITERAPLQDDGERVLQVIGDLYDMIAATGNRQVVVAKGEEQVNAAAYATLMAMLGEGRLRPVIDSSYRFEEIIEAHRRVDEGRKVGSVVVT